MACHETARPVFGVQLSRKQKPSRSLLQPWQSDRVLAHIEAHLECSLRGAELAAVMGLSSSSFRRAFTLRFGLPPHAYVMRSRVERAKNLMLADGKALAGRDRSVLRSVGSVSSHACFSPFRRRHT